MNAIRARASYVPTAKFATWLYTLAHHRLVDHWRSRGAVRLESLDDDGDEGTAALVDAIPGSRTDEPETRAHSSAARAAIDAALRELPAASQIKLYNAGSFFDPAAIPPSADDEIARLVSGFDRVIVEAHPAFLTGAYAERCLRFRDLIVPARLEVAIGLETAHRETLSRLNKRMTVESFQRAAAFLAENEIDLRVFILLNPPFLGGDDAVTWAARSIDLAADCGATACSVIPTRSGNGAMEALGDAVERPRLPALERVVEYGVSNRRLRVFADLWDVEQFVDCDCSTARRDRLRQINRTQIAPSPVPCTRCESRERCHVAVAT